jgi:hypothetical protein
LTFSLGEAGGYALLYYVDRQALEGIASSPNLDIIGANMRAICAGRFMGLARCFLIHDNKL